MKKGKTKDKNKGKDEGKGAGKGTNTKKQEGISLDAAKQKEWKKFKDDMDSGELPDFGDDDEPEPNPSSSSTGNTEQQDVQMLALQSREETRLRATTQQKNRVEMGIKAEAFDEAREAIMRAMVKGPEYSKEETAKFERAIKRPDDKKRKNEEQREQEARKEAKKEGEDEKMAEEKPKDEEAEPKKKAKKESMVEGMKTAVAAVVAATLPATAESRNIVTYDPGNNVDGKQRYSG